MPNVRNDRPVTIRVLKDGRVRVHFFAHDPKGPIHTGRADLTHSSGKRLPVGGASGRIACQPGLQNLTATVVAGRLHPIHCTAESGAVSCPECMQTEAFQKAAEAQAELESSL